MTDKFLKAKHWQLFTLILGIPIVFELVLMGVMLLNINSETHSDTAEIFYLLKFFPVMMLLYMGAFLGWIWSIAIGLQSKVPKDIKMKTKKFKILFFIPVVYICCISLFIGGLFSAIAHHGPEPSSGFIAVIIAIISPLHLAAMFGIFYALYFAAKTYKTVVLQKEVTFADFAGDFFMLWFYFIGIWILQPKINTLAANKKHDLQ